tara:strand:+ start:835 stop:987 length:153 start_codon:yes stop_codon:yes gene_type:complete
MTFYPDTIYEKEYPTHSEILDLRGNPLPYENRTPLGFDLSKTSRKELEND